MQAQAHGSAARSCESGLALPSRRYVRTRSRGQAHAPLARWLGGSTCAWELGANPARRVRRILRCRRCAPYPE
eukprot:4532950-Prymnesium_polylepis.1